MPETITPNCYPGRKGYTPEIVVLHLTEGEFQSAFDWFQNPKSDASATVIVRRDGSVVWIVGEEDAPWTNGFRKDQLTPPSNLYVWNRCWGKFSPNLITLSVEIEWFQKDGVIPTAHPIFKTLVTLLVDWCARYGMPLRERVMGHNEIDPTGKPFCGKHIPWAALFAAVEEVHKVNPNDPSPWATDLWNRAKAAGITDGSNPRGQASREEVAAMILRGIEGMVKPSEVRVMDIPIPHPDGL